MLEFVWSVCGIASDQTHPDSQTVAVRCAAHRLNAHSVLLRLGN